MHILTEGFAGVSVLQLS